jgi:amino acid adenylation domain-containing protein
LDKLAGLVKAKEALLVKGIPNRRVELAVTGARLLSKDKDFRSVEELRRAIARQATEGVDPEEILTIAEKMGQRAQLSWANCDQEGGFDALLTNGQYEVPTARVDLRTWAQFANEPTHQSSFVSLVPRLRNHLREKLPDYMVPSAFVLLEELPLTTIGKIDRRRLPPPERARPPLTAEFVSPRNSNEEKIASLWAEVLGIDRVGINDDFFDLGGHSLLALQVISRMRESFGIELSFKSFFESPTVASIAAAVKMEKPADGPVMRKAGATSAPLSSGQLRLWFMDQLIPGTTIYNVPASIRLARGADLEALERSLNEIVRRHETLRTVFRTHDGEPVQEILPALHLPLPIIDLTKQSPDKKDSEVQRLTNESAKTVFDLHSGPLLKATVLRLSEEDHVLLLTMHHIIADGWSWKVLFKELGTLYEAFAKGQSSPLPELPIQYSDFVSWQNELLRDGVIASQLTFWSERLAGAPLVLELPSDYPRPAVQSFRGSRQTLSLSDSLTANVRDFAKREKVTLFMTMLTAFKVLLHRYTGQADILVGSPIANRPRTECEQLIGFFLNNLVVRSTLSPEQSFREVLRKVSENALAAYANQDVPFEKIVEAINPNRDLSRPAIFQVFFNLLNFAERIELPGLTEGSLSPVEVWAQPAEPGSQFDLTLYVGERPESIQLVLLYNSDVFSRERVTVMLHQFRCLLEQAVTSPDQPLVDYSLLNPEAKRVLPDPAIPLDEPSTELFTETFLSCVNKWPTNTALKLGHESWSYERLAARSRSIAKNLVAGGLTKGEVVAVTGPQSFELIAAMLGVFLSGGVLLTLDQNLPSERRRVMLKEANASRLLYSGDTPDLPLPASRIADISQLTETSLPSLNANDAAYLFFTSGTSGTPKGVLGCHKGLSHFLKWQRETFGIGPGDRSAQLTGLSFDVVLRDIFLPLTSGATLCLPEPRVYESAQQLVEWLRDDEISILHTVPSLAQSWINELKSPIALPNLRCTFFAGEPLTDILVEHWRRTFGREGKLINLYGPTETTLAKCFFVVADQPLFGVQPVGSPMPNSQALVLNGHQLCGIGEPGEIAIRTPFRTLGYVNSAEEQRSRFIKNPFTVDDNDLIYLTGDRGRYRPDGQLEILGRLDQQVKIRGVRIEPGEVNATLARNSAISASVVVATEDEHGENALAAYVVSTSQIPNLAAELRSHLERRLPAAMIPTYFVFLDSLPLTLNGKVDRSRLPEPERSRRDRADHYAAPGTPTEEVIAAIWSDVLRVPRVGVRDNFFELGGHSLNVMKVMARVRAAFQVDLPLTTLFEAGTVSGLAAAVEQRLMDELELMSEEEVDRLSR